MSIQRFGRYGMALCLVGLVSGCSMLGFGETEQEIEENRCKLNPKSCMYEGSYEPGERQYAEEEARRLNKAASERLRRNRL